MGLCEWEVYESIFSLHRVMFMLYVNPLDQQEKYLGTQRLGSFLLNSDHNESSSLIGYSIDWHQHQYSAREGATGDITAKLIFTNVECNK